ncbi:MAG: ATP-binding protein [Chloroflexota bacterium]
MSQPTVLVVDDEIGISLLVERLLTKAGFAVSAFNEPRLAVEHLGQNKIDLLLVDIRMPELDGFTVIDHAKRHQPDIAVLVMTGFGTVETAIQALRKGVDGLILKPFESGDELVQACRLALADNQQKRDVARMRALRPLFNVAETLLVETRPDHLMDLILGAVTGHLDCAHAGYYQYDPFTHALTLLAGRGVRLADDNSDDPAGLIGHVDASNTPLVQNVSGPGEPVFQEILRSFNLESAMCVPVARPATRGVIFAGRGTGRPVFREADLDMFTILAHQAAIALENARLYDDLRDYIRQVEESQQALIQAEKMATAGRLTASIAHEINNPLQAVQNCLHLVGRTDLPAVKRQEYFELANSELQRLMATVRRILDYYRPGGQETEMVSVPEVLERVLRLVEKQLLDRTITVETDLPASLPSIIGVSNQVQQVFMNLILNAYDAMPEGGLIRIRARQVGKMLQVTVSDTGPGIPEENRQNIFDPFVSTKPSGMGLGLTVSYNIITSHGGKLELEPDYKAGASFRISLPVRKEL